ncbi:hypothetical protein GCM10010080_10400 [Thermomonas carbonis]|nr:hypothetical protein [Thermomonas carbonis]GHB99484.1 hypothetical protein GCM10010080_10400 [Thermomonas carbonis]
MAVAYHYTRFHSAIQIIQSGKINLSVPDPNGPFASEPSAVWFSTVDGFELGMGTLINIPETGERLQFPLELQAELWGLARFRTDTALLTSFNDLVLRGQCMDSLLSDLSAGHDVNDWYVSERPFSLRWCTGADLYIDGRWVPLTAETLEAMRCRLPSRVGATMTEALGILRARSAPVEIAA